jgi:hypothetical protein
MKKFNLLLVFFLTSYCVKSQTPYVDVLTAPAMAVYAVQISNKQDETIDEMNKLQQAQAFISTQMVVANDIQNKVYKGLREINGSVKNGLQVTRIYSNLQNTVTEMNKLREVVVDAPEFAIFATKATQTAINKSTDIYTDVADLLTAGDLNLATSGDRRRLLYNIEQNTRLLNIYLINMRLSIQRAKRKGFWKSANPFQTYVNTDKQLFDSILSNAGRL